MNKKPMTYAQAGVDLSCWNVAKEKIAKQVRSTYTSNVVGGFGQFGGMFDVSMLKDYNRPVLVSSVDGVGTKIKIAAELKRYHGVGEDIVNHCINDILVLGAQPLFFLDYLGIGKLTPDVAEQVVSGVAQACKASGCVLIGGETAEMPDVYAKNDFDLAGTIIGVVDADDIIDGRTILPGDVLIGFESSGLHTNGYSLARKIVTEAAQKKYTDILYGSTTIADALLVPHRAYSPLLPFLRKKIIKGCAHITGGGFQDNLDRILPKTCDAVVDTTSWTPLPIFKFLQEQGAVEPDEMYHTFNMGVGMVMAVEQSNVGIICNAPELGAFSPKVIGKIEAGSGVVKLLY